MSALDRITCTASGRTNPIATAAAAISTAIGHQRRRAGSSAEATGVTAWTGQFLIAKAGESRMRLLSLTMLLVAVLTALINLNGAVAALLSMMWFGRLT